MSGLPLLMAPGHLLSPTEPSWGLWVMLTPGSGQDTPVEAELGAGFWGTYVC